MGIMNHNAVLAVSEFGKYHDQLRAWIAALPPAEQELFTEVRGVINGVVTFMLAPEGSKEGWPESDAGDDLRARFITWLREMTPEDDYVSDWKWVEVGWGEYGQTVLQGNNVNCFGDEPYAVAGDAA